MKRGPGLLDPGPLSLYSDATMGELAPSAVVITPDASLTLGGASLAASKASTSLVSGPPSAGASLAVKTFFGPVDDDAVCRGSGDK